MNEKLTIALTKGRILKETLPLLARAGIEPLEDVSSSRKLVFDTTSSDVQLVIIRGTDVPTYVRHGAADMGVVGKDILLEHGAGPVRAPGPGHRLLPPDDRRSRGLAGNRGAHSGGDQIRQYCQASLRAPGCACRGDQAVRCSLISSTPAIPCGLTAWSRWKK
jgi:hypothetical protein